MNGFHFNAVTFNGEVFCKECVPQGASVEDCEPIFATSEWEIAPMCSECGEVHDYVSVIGSEE